LYFSVYTMRNVIKTYKLTYKYVRNKGFWKGSTWSWLFFIITLLNDWNSYVTRHYAKWICKWIRALSSVLLKSIVEKNILQYWNELNLYSSYLYFKIVSMNICLDRFSSSNTLSFSVNFDLKIIFDIARYLNKFTSLMHLGSLCVVYILHFCNRNNYVCIYIYIYIYIYIMCINISMYK